jgi:hypothetical protein
MKKKTIITTLSLVAIALPVFGVLVPDVTHADVISGILNDTVYSATAYFAGIIFTAAGWFISLCGVLLNGVMVATLNMKTIVDGTPAINIAWGTIRDFSSIFIIFMLLYASISMILGAKGPSLGTLIKNVIIAGLLINFSLFGTKLLIDASNIISTSFYCAMASQSGPCTNPNNTAITSAFSSAGISNIFMQSLDIQQIVGTSPDLQGNNPELSITLANIGGSILMVVAGLSFITAAIMFAIRIGVLILLMAFSPIYFIAMIVPQVGAYAKKWSGMLYSMCIFMPVYLFLMYIAVSVLNDPKFFSFLVPTAGTSVGLMSAHTVGIILQYIIAFIMINAPLLAALSVAGEGASFVNTMTASVKKWGQGQIEGGARKAWTETGGRAMSKIAENERFKDLASNSAVVDILHRGVSGAAGSYNEKLQKQIGVRTKRAEELGYDQRAMNVADAQLRNLNAQLAQAQATGQPTTNLKTAIGNVKQTQTDIENQRKQNVANRIGSRTLGVFGSSSTLFTKIARKEKVAAAKLQIPILKDQLDKHKDDLKDTKAEIKQLQNAITNNPAAGNTPAGTATIAQTTRLNQLFGDQTRHTTNINNTEALMDNLKLVK